MEVQQPKIKEEIFIHIGRRGGDGQSGWRGRAARWWLEDRQWLADWAVPHLHVDKPVGTTGEQDRLHNPGFQSREIKPQNLWL